jgi:GntR family transcriptional regulator, trigonelline degradation regulator
MVRYCGGFHHQTVRQDKGVRIAAPLRREITDAIRNAIVEGDYPPGLRLVESQLCSTFDVSRTVVREALRQLETEGIVVNVPNKGPEVASLSSADVSAIYEVRARIEGLVGFLFAQRATGELCATLVGHQGHIDAAIRSGDAHQFLSAKDAYYSCLIEGAGNDIAAAVLSNLRSRVQLIRRLSFELEDRRPQVLAETRRMTTAAAVMRDPAEADQACRAHVEAAAVAALYAIEHLDPQREQNVPVAAAASST